MKRKLLNVRSLLEHVVFTCDDMLERTGQQPNGLFLTPIDKENLLRIRFFAWAVLKVKGRKDVYVNRTGRKTK